MARQARDEMARLVRSKEWELAKTAVDAAGVVDPSPLSDGIGMVMSLAEGDSRFQPGSWTGEPGKSTFVPDTSKPAVTYREGYPDFSPHVQKVNGVPAQVQIDMQGTYGRTGNGDFAVATQAMRDKLKDPTWTPDYDRYTWHHHENGTTMQLVPKSINDGFPHTGGASIVKGPTGGKEF